MAFSAVVAVAAGASAYQGKQQKKAAESQANAAREAADVQAKADREIAEQQRVQAEALATQQRAAEAARVQAQREQETEQRRQLADADNAALSQNEPTIQLAASGEDGTQAARKRRASFRPEYASGITI